MNILVVEDDLKLASVMRRLLIEARHTVDMTEDGWAGRTLATVGHYDVIILDRLLPRLDGLEVCRQIRAEGVITPVLICSAYADLDDCVAGLEAGADDYLAKPFALEELIARVHALGRRASVRTLAAAVWAPGAGNDAAPVMAMTAAPAAAMQAAPQAAATRHAQGVAGYLRHAWTSSLHWLSPGGSHRDAEQEAAIVGPRGLTILYRGESEYHHHHKGD